MNTARGGRFGHIDALKGAGILLVVFGHLIEKPSAQSVLLQALYIGIYSFHMPLFVFLSGIFARATLNSGDYRKIIWTLFFPLVFFQALYLGVAPLTDWYSYSPFTPYWLLWFIASLIGWRLLLPLFASPAGLAVAVLGAVFVGYDGAVGYALSAARTIYFLPFFVLGHLYGLQLVKRAQRHRLPFAGLFVAVMLVVTLWWVNGLDGSALTGSRDYGATSPALAYPGLGRLLVLSLSLGAVLGFCALIPARSSGLVWLGERSLSIYLLHGLAVMALVGAGATGLIPQPALLPVLVGATVVMAVATALVDGTLRSLFRPPDGNGDLADRVVGWRRSR